MDSLYIIIPAYNEADNITNIIDEWYPVIASNNGDGRSRLVIIDDGSKDDTYALASAMTTDREYLTVLTKTNGGHGSTIYYGYKYALDNGADYIFQTDSDGQTLASEFDSFWNDRDKYDAIIGDRTLREDGIARKMVSAVLRMVVAIIFRVKVPDVNTPFRLMKRDALSNALQVVPENYNLTNVALTGVLAKTKANMEFKAITFRPRQAGTNSINIPKIIKIGIKAVTDLIKISGNTK